MQGRRARSRLLPVSSPPSPSPPGLSVGPRGPAACCEGLKSGPGTHGALGMTGRGPRSAVWGFRAFPRGLQLWLTQGADRSASKGISSLPINLLWLIPCLQPRPCHHASGVPVSGKPRVVGPLGSMETKHSPVSRLPVLSCPSPRANPCAGGGRSREQGLALPLPLRLYLPSLLSLSGL